MNNAGIYPFKSFLDADDAFSQRVMQTNLFSVYRMCQHMISLRRKIGGITCDTLGAVCELVEATVLLAALEISS